MNSKSSTPQEQDRLADALRASARGLPENDIVRRGLMNMAADRLATLEHRQTQSESGAIDEQRRAYAEGYADQVIKAREEGWYRDTVPLTPSATGEAWRPMVSAPLDGTEIEILFRHFDYWASLKLDGKEKADEQWQAAQRAHWIDHNGGGWTWHGMAGTPVGWRPLDAIDRTVPSNG